MVKIPKIKDRLVVGLTGVFGSGKTSASLLFKKSGVHVIDCDEIVRNIYKSENPILKKIIKKFGLKHRAELAQVVFADDKKRRQLEKLIHPHVFQKIVSDLKRIKRGIVVIDMPLLFEVGFDRNVERVLVVSSKATAIRKRLEKRGFTSSQISKRLRAQMPLREKVKRADFIIDNSGNFRNLKTQVENVLDSLKSIHH